MRAFLYIFFTRHYFQAQNSFIEHLISDEFISIILDGQLHVLDIGCGPAVVSLAITELLDSLVKILIETGQWSRPRILELTYILNDTSPICLGVAKQMQEQYFGLQQYSQINLVPNTVFGVEKGFPDNLQQLRRIAQNYGSFDVASLAYVITPLTEQSSITGLASDVSLLGSLCAEKSCIVILQDKFKGELVRRLGRMLGATVRRREYTQQVHSNRNPNETFTYSYYDLLYKPLSESGLVRSFSNLPDQAVAFSEIAEVS
jgi:SAM-dependent methyltransferase